jgi:hypothetical protein
MGTVSEALNDLENGSGTHGTGLSPYACFVTTPPRHSRFRGNDEPGGNQLEVVPLGSGTVFLAVPVFQDCPI